MDRERWLTSRITYVETTRAIELGARPEDDAASAVVNEWQSFDVVELTTPVAERAAALAVAARLRSLDAIHLASALFAAPDDLILATWDVRLHVAAGKQGCALLPERI